VQFKLCGSYFEERPFAGYMWTRCCWADLVFAERHAGWRIVLHVCAPRTRATSLSPRPMRGLSWLLNGPARRDVGYTREGSDRGLRWRTLVLEHIFSAPIQDIVEKQVKVKP
jgi:hypothetical protein